VRAVSTNVAPPRLLFGLPLDAGVDASKNPPCWTDATKIREEPRNKHRDEGTQKKPIQTVSTRGNSHRVTDRPNNVVSTEDAEEPCKREKRYQTVGMGIGVQNDRLLDSGFDL